MFIDFKCQNDKNEECSFNNLITSNLVGKYVL